MTILCSHVSPYNGTLYLLQSFSICNWGLSRTWLLLWISKGPGQGSGSESTGRVQGLGLGSGVRVRVQVEGFKVSGSGVWIKGPD